MKKDSKDKRARKLAAQLCNLTQIFNHLQFDFGQSECNMTPQEMKAVEFLGRAGATRMKDLAEHLRLAVSSTTALVDKLEIKEAITRNFSSEDRRVVLVKLTDKGARAYEQTAKAYLDVSRKMLNALDDGDQEQFIEIMGKINVL